MGCGAVCGSSSSVAENSKQAEAQLISLLKQIMPNQYLYPVKAIARFSKQMQLYPHKLQLILTDKLQPKCTVSVGVMEKWKIILFGLDCDRLSYVNCLGYPDNALKTKVSADKQAPDQNNNSKLPEAIQVSENMELFQHKAFTQIEKDIQRTFPDIEFQKKSFTMVLKRISNHFPIMGYTQGINFIVGYLLIIGFSQSDAFWLFTHMAINRRYMMLGLYQDGFPLINVYTCIFRNVLKRLNQRLYQHLYKNIVMFQQSAWVFKWFMTCFLSNFPLQMCQFVWDLVLTVGGIGMVKFAIAMILKLEPHLYEYQDACDITQFLTNLRQIQTFNKYLCIREIIKNAYKVKIQKADLDQLNQIKTERGGQNFYANYFLFFFEEQILNSKQPKQPVPQQQVNQNNPTDQLHHSNPILFKKMSLRRSSQLLDSWYERLVKQRKQFKQQAKQLLRKRTSVITYNLDNVNQQILNKKSDLNLPSQQLQQISLDIDKSKRKSRTSIQQFGSMEIFESELRKVESKKDSSSKIDSAQVSPANKMKNSSNRYSTKKTKKQQILWKEDDEQQQIQQIKDKMMNMEDDLYYIARDIRFKRKTGLSNSDDILAQFVNPKKPKEHNNKYLLKGVNYLKPQSSTDVVNQNLNNSRLSKAGHSIISSNMSASNASNRSSASSYRTNHKQNCLNANARQCKCAKIKTQQNQLETIPVAKTKVQKIIQPQEILDHEQSVDQIANPTRKRMNTYQDWMINSQGPRASVNLQVSNVKQPSDIGSEVEIMHGMHMFKKKNRANKANGCVVHDCPENIVEHQVSQSQSRNHPTPVLPQQESCQSFFIGNISSRRSEVGDIESVK